MPPILDYAGVTVFALTGALAAARDKHDIITFWFFAVVTGVGGGTLRDLLIGAPVFWVSDPTYLGIGAIASLIVWFAGERVERVTALNWLDALGLAAYAVIGAGKALALDVNPFIAVAMGVLTACFGGVIRDVLAGQPSILLKREISISAALLAAALFVALTLGGLAPVWAGVAGAVAGFGLRAGAIHYGWALPSFGEQRGRKA
ncbi:trimeric intracellular cation channel family protein [Terricaulis sp.]|uniref:trimeric intracellular cation channel family protein n=1 Tax=Terricaulis sp. TaxID=2768686 RepID=UPI0037852930